MVVNSKSLLTAINSVSSAVTGNQILPILENIKFESVEGGCMLTATDLEITLTAFCECTGSIDVTIPSKRLMSTLKALPEQVITIEVSDADMVTIKGDKGRYKMGGEPSKDYPSTPIVEGEETDLVFHDFHDAITRAVQFASNDELRPAMTGIYFDNGKVVATDAHTLCVLPTEFDGQFILPKKAVNVLKGWNSTNVNVVHDVNMVKVSDGRTTLYAKKIDARYPAYNQVIPSWSSYPITININRSELISSLKRVAIFANQTTNLVQFDFKGDVLELSCADIDVGNAASETMAVEKIDGADITIGFNARLAIKTLSAIQDESVRMHLQEPTRAGLIYQESSDETYLLMPVMLTN